MGFKGLSKIKEKIREYKIKRELAQIEEIYTAQPQPPQPAQQRKKASAGWGELDEYFKNQSK